MPKTYKFLYYKKDALGDKRALNDLLSQTHTSTAEVVTLLEIIDEP